MQFRNIIMENDLRVRGDASAWISRATFQNGKKAYEIRDGETVFGIGFRAAIQAKTLMMGGDSQTEIIDRVFDKRVTPRIQVSGHQNTLSEDPLEYMGVQHDEAVFCVDGLEHIKVSLAVLKRKSDSALIITKDDERAHVWVEALKQAGKSVVNLASKSGEYPCMSVTTVSGYLAELTGQIHAWDALNLDPGMLIVDQCELLAAEDLKKVARSVRPAFRMGFMQSPPADVSDMQAICHEMGPWIFGRPKNAREFSWDSPL